MNGLAITIIVGQLPKLFGFSTDADGFFDEVRAFVTQPRPDRHDGPRRRRRRAGSCCSSCRGITTQSRQCSSRSSAPPSSRRCSTSPRGRRDRRRAPPGRSRRPTLPWTERSDVGPLLVAAVGITLVSLTDTIATATSFAARRGDEVDPEPGDDRHRRRQHRRRVLPGLRDLDQRVADRGRRAVRGEEPADRTSSAPASWSSCSCCSSTRCSPTCPSRRSPRSSSPRRFR